MGTTPTSPERNSSQVSSSTPPQAQSAPWSGRETTLFSPDVRCSVPLDHSILSQAPSVETSASMSEETLFTVPMLSNPPTRKSLSGSRMRNSSHGNPTPTHGSTSEQYISVTMLRNCEIFMLMISIGRLQHVVVNDSAKI